MYMYVISGGLLVVAHLLSAIYVEDEQEDYEYKGATSLLDDASSIEHLGINLAYQGGITATIAYLIDLKSMKRLPLLIYTLPMLARLCGYPVEHLHRIHNFSSIFAILLATFFIFNKIPLVLDFAKSGLQKASLAIQVYGWIPFMLALWFKLLLPVQFFLFWLILFGLQLFKYVTIYNHPIFNEGWLVVLLASIAECCVTAISRMGLCVAVSYVSFIVLTVSKFFLQGWQSFTNDNLMHQGWTEGFTMFLLALQTGLIELKASHRAFLMSIVLFIVLSSLIQSMYEIAEPILLSLGASQSKQYWKHVRAVFLCTFLWVFPLYMTRMICQVFDVDFWLMVVISSCVLTSVQVLGSLVIYSLFIYDALRTNPWESLDDVVYYAKASTRVMEFIVAVFVVLYGVKESIFGDWSWFNSSILIIHCYFNVWQRLQAGWKSYLLRREAVKKIESLPEATAQQLEELDDVCAICIQPLVTQVRITPCRHFFHAICLRKWLYVQEKCPLCHQSMQPTEADTPNEEEEEGEHGAGDGVGDGDGDGDIEGAGAGDSAGDGNESMSSGAEGDQDYAEAGASNEGSEHEGDEIDLEV